MYLIFDTETTGLPKKYKAPIEELDNWPRIVQIAWQLFNENETCISKKDYIIKPNGFIIPDNAAKIHGITTKRAVDEGHLIEPVLKEFSKEIEKSDHIIAHNLFFDEKIISAEFLRNNIKHSFQDINKICTMKASTKFCKLPHQYGGLKWPNLQELHIFLFKYEFEGMHNASADVDACAKCFFELKKRNIL